MGNIASSSGGHWNLSKPQPQWKSKPKSPPPPKKSLWLQRQDSSGSSDSNDDWYIFKAPRSPHRSPHRSPRRPGSPPPRRR